MASVTFDAMYYPQQSPGIAQKMPTHQHPGQIHDSPWSRAGHHPVLGPPNHAQQPTSPAYSLFPHANGAMNPMQHHPHPHMSGPLGHHHHQNSLTHAHYQSPPNGNGLQSGMVQNGSPGSGVVTQIITPHWQNQLLKCEVSVPNFVGVGALRSRERSPLLLCCSGEALFGAVKRFKRHMRLYIQTLVCRRLPSP